MRKVRAPSVYQHAASSAGVESARRKNPIDSALVSEIEKRYLVATPTVPHITAARTISSSPRRPATRVSRMAIIRESHPYELSCAPVQAIAHAGRGIRFSVIRRESRLTHVVPIVNIDG